MFSGVLHPADREEITEARADADIIDLRLAAAVGTIGGLAGV